MKQSSSLCQTHVYGLAVLHEACKHVEMTSPQVCLSKEASQLKVSIMEELLHISFIKSVFPTQLPLTLTTWAQLFEKKSSCVCFISISGLAQTHQFFFQIMNLNSLTEAVSLFDRASSWGLPSGVTQREVSADVQGGQGCLQVRGREVGHL